MKNITSGHYPFSGNAVLESAKAVAWGEMESAAIIKESDGGFRVTENAQHDSIYAAIDAQTAQGFRKHGYFRAVELVKDHLIADAKRRNDKRGKNHDEYPRISLGSSDIASIVLRAPEGICELKFGGDRTYSAYLVDAECKVPDYYRLEWTCKSWLWIYDDHTKTQELHNHGRAIRVYTAGEYGCIIQLL